MFVRKYRSLFFKQKQNSQHLSVLIHANSHNLQQIYRHSFNQQLFDGSLCPTIFGRYLRDDYFYLHHFSSVLQTLSLNTVKINADLAKQLNYLAKDIIDNELSMQLQYKVHLKDNSGAVPGDAISYYVEYLKKTAIKSEIPIGLSAILPCFWIYHELGIISNHVCIKSSNPYKKWIETYSSPEFIQATQSLAKTVNSLLEQSTPEIQSKMKLTFAHAVQCELNFFEEVCIHPTRQLIV